MMNYMLMYHYNNVQSHLLTYIQMNCFWFLFYNLNTFLIYLYPWARISWRGPPMNSPRRFFHFRFRHLLMLMHMHSFCKYLFRSFLDIVHFHLLFVRPFYSIFVILRICLFLALLFSCCMYMCDYIH